MERRRQGGTDRPGGGRGRLRRWADGLTRLVGVVARPARRSRGRDGVVVEPYRGYGSTTEMFLIGRVYRQTPPRRDEDPNDLRMHLRDIGRRIRRRKVSGAVVTASFAEARQVVRTDADGYFRFHLRLAEPPPTDRSWHTVSLELEGETRVSAEARVFVPPPECRFVVVSDIDDTIMFTGVANKLAMLWRLFVSDAESRVAFPGAAALYRALHAGTDGEETNPLLYVSRAPWGIYDMLTAFFRMHGIPVGPVLFLREWGVSWTWPFPRRAELHKRELVDRMLALYADLPFVLIGDSGQKDPEIYADIVDAHPGRIRAVYIRDVSKAAGRIAEIEKLTAAVVSAGSHLVLAQDSTAMAAHMASIGLIAPGDVREVDAERAKAGDRAPAGPDPIGARSIPGEAESAATAVGDRLRSASGPTTVIVAPSTGGVEASAPADHRSHERPPDRGG